MVEREVVFNRKGYGLPGLCRYRTLLPGSGNWSIKLNVEAGTQCKSSPELIFARPVLRQAIGFVQWGLVDASMAKGAR